VITLSFSIDKVDFSGGFTKFHQGIVALQN